MSQEFVVDGATFSCPLGTAKLKLQVIKSSTTAGGPNLANTDNYMVPPPGGQCLQCPTAPQLCIPSVEVLDPGQSIVLVDGKVALSSSCSLMCQKGGMLILEKTGQSVVET